MSSQVVVDEILLQAGIAKDSAKKIGNAVANTRNELSQQLKELPEHLDPKKLTKKLLDELATLATDLVHVTIAAQEVVDGILDDDKENADE